MKFHRIIIYAKDIQRITGKSDRYGRLLMKRMRDYFKKDEHQFISVEEFCSYTGLNYEQVVGLLD